MKALLLVNVLFVLLALFSLGLVVRSHIATTAKYAEFERAGCVNESALLEFGKNRFRPDYRQDVALWLAGPAQQTAQGASAIALIISVANTIFLSVIVLNGKSEKTSA